jgi:hypothetical protein
MDILQFEQAIYLGVCSTYVARRALVYMRPKEKCMA